jgi:hypothetical protein
MEKASQHPNNHVIVIKAKYTIAHEAQKELEDWFAQTRKSIGGYFKGGSSRQSGSGLEDWEIDILMPIQLGMTKTDKDFRKEVDLFYTNINTRVPIPGGVNLQIGLTEDNSKPIKFKNEEGDMVENLPINVEDYIRYRHAIGAPDVAPTEAEAGAVTYNYYVVDSNARKAEARAKESVVDTALEYFLEVRQTPKEVAMHLTLLGEDYRKLDKEDRPSTLKRLILQGRAEDFTRNYKDGDNLIKFDIAQYVKTGIVLKEGNRYIFDAVQVGVTEKDFIEYLKDDNNNETIAIIKARYAELRK